MPRSPRRNRAPRPQPPRPCGRRRRFAVQCGPWAPARRASSCAGAARWHRLRPPARRSRPASRRRPTPPWASRAVRRWRPTTLASAVLLVERTPHLLDGAPCPGPDGVDGDVEARGDVARRQVLVETQHQHVAVLRIEAEHRFDDPLLPRQPLPTTPPRRRRDRAAPRAPPARRAGLPIDVGCGRCSGRFPPSHGRTRPSRGGSLCNGGDVGVLHGVFGVGLVAQQRAGNVQDEFAVLESVVVSITNRWSRTPESIQGPPL